MSAAPPTFDEDDERERELERLQRHAEWDEQQELQEEERKKKEADDRVLIVDAVEQTERKHEDRRLPSIETRKSQKKKKKARSKRRGRGPTHVDFIKKEYRHRPFGRRLR